MSADRDSAERVTIYDVAKHAQVAPSTVSRAFSRPGRVSAATHAKVMASAKALGYRSAPPPRRSAPSATTAWASRSPTSPIPTSPS